MQGDAGTSAKGAAERLHALDAVRGFALLLGVVFHAALAFLPGPQAWLVMEQSRSSTIAGLKRSMWPTWSGTPRVRAAATRPMRVMTTMISRSDMPRAA